MNTNVEANMSAERFAGFIPAHLMSRSGEVFYSGRKAFSKKSSIYLLGHNPGTDPSVPGMRTIAESIHQTLFEYPETFSRYIDESWHDRSPGQNPMQRRIACLFDRIGVDLASVPASNLIFPRAHSEAKIKPESQTLEDDCWPFHKAVIETLGIRMILCMGGATFSAVASRLNAAVFRDSFIEQNDRGWSSCAYENNEGILVVKLSHPSRANWINETADPSPMVKKMLNGIVAA